MSRDALQNRSRGAVFLCYHSIAEGGPPFLSVTPDAFERQLALLRRLGFRSGRLSDLQDLVEGRQPSSRLVFLTFDDGYADNHANAMPLLEAYGFRAWFFVLPTFVDAGASLLWPRVERHVETHPGIMRSLDWSMIGELRASGHEIGSHTLTHPHLADLEDDRLHAELDEARRRIADRVGACTAIAYPFGEWSPRVVAAAASAGYAVGFTLPYGAQRNADRLTIPRIGVDHRDDEHRFRLKLTEPYRRALLSPLKPALRMVLRRSPAHEDVG